MSVVLTTFPFVQVEKQKKFTTRPPTDKSHKISADFYRFLGQHDANGIEMSSVQFAISGAGPPCPTILRNRIILLEMQLCP